MGFVSLRTYIVALIVIIVLLGITGAVGTFGWHWVASPTRCQEPRTYEFQQWKRLATFGHLELRYKPAELVCDTPLGEYNPKEYKPLYQTSP